MPRTTPSRFAPERRDSALAAFAAEQPGYGAGSPLALMRASEYGRLDDAGQKHVDDSWNRALTPVDKLDRQVGK